MRQIDSSGQPVTIEVFSPPSGPAKHLYEPYIEADMRSHDFVETVITGLQNSALFASKLLQLEADYGNGTTGEMIRRAVTSVPVQQPLEPIGTLKEMFRIDTDAARLETLKWLLMEASIQTTVAQLVTNEAGADPVTDDRYMGQLLAVRSSTAPYVETPIRLGPYLGLAFAESVIPDQILDNLNFTDILDYRRKSADAYIAWMAEVDRIAAELDDCNPLNLKNEIPKLITTDLMPKVVEYRAEMANVRDELFGDLIKGVTRWEVPALLVAFGTGESLGAAVMSFAAAALGGAARPIIDSIVKSRKSKREHTVSYLVDVSSMRTGGAT